MIYSTTVHTGRINSLLFDYTILKDKFGKKKNNALQLSLHCKYNFDEIYTKEFNNRYFEMFFLTDENDKNIEFVRKYDFNEVSEIPEKAGFIYGSFNKQVIEFEQENIEPTPEVIEEEAVNP